MFSLNGASVLFIFFCHEYTMLMIERETDRRAFLINQRDGE